MRFLFSITVVVVALFVGLSLAQPSSSTYATGAELLPDLQTLNPRDIELVTVRSGRNVEIRLRFSNEVVNKGSGPLELYPVQESACKGRVAYQRIFQDSSQNGHFNRGIDAVAAEQPVGCMVFHAQHQHWHLENFANYQLKAIGANGTVGAVVAQSTKISFCIIDMNRREPGLAGSPSSAYYTACNRTSTNGLSVGWSDVYRSTLADQYIVLPQNLPAGDYCLVSIADPVNQIKESNATNNGVGVRISLNIAANSVSPRNPTTLCGP